MYSGLTLKVILYRNNSALVTQRQLTYTWTLLVSALLGTVFGLMQLIGIAMEQTENFCKKLQVKEEVKTTFSNIKNQQTHIFTNFPIEEANDTQCLNNRTVSETVETYFKFT